MQPLQQVESPGISLPTVPPQIVFNRWMVPPYYHTMSPLSPQSPPLPRSLLPALGEQPLCFQPLAAAVSKDVKHTVTKPTRRDVDRRTAVPANLSAEDERILINALKRQKERKLTMQKVFEELIQVRIDPYRISMEYDH